MSFGYAAFHVVKEEQVYQRYLTLYNRRLRFPALESRPVSLLSQCSSLYKVVSPQRSAANVQTYLS